MKMVIAIIRPQRMEMVKNALEKVGIFGLTVNEVKGRGRQKGVTQMWRGSKYRVDLLQKIEIIIVVKEVDVDKCIRTIVESARTGEIGDGKIFVLPLEKTIRIRTGESGEEAV